MQTHPASYRDNDGFIFQQDGIIYRYIHPRYEVHYNKLMESGLYELLINETGAKALQKNMEFVGPITYTKEELDFGEKIMTAYGLEVKGINGNIKPLEVTKENPPGGSTDVGDVSYIVPEITLLTTTAPFTTLFSDIH